MMRGRSPAILVSLVLVALAAGAQVHRRDPLNSEETDALREVAM